MLVQTRVLRLLPVPVLIEVQVQVRVPVVLQWRPVGLKVLLQR